ncbi:VVA0879 family protein [Streptomyces syringium]|uniref:VVA0879 family protein n=1 Tax=Streptomyces syringium TaxID=76729 RepID=UPI0037CD8D44
MPRNRRVQRDAKRRNRETGEGYAAARERVAGKRPELPALGSILTLAEWQAAGAAYFGTAETEKWSVLCPHCGHFTTAGHIMEVAQSTDTTIAFTECLGRYLAHGGPESFPCNWTSYGFIPSLGYTLVREDGRTLRVFPFAATDADLDANRQRFLERAARWRAERQAEEDEEAAAEEDQEGDEDADEWCLDCTRPLGRRHRPDCVWRTAEELGECTAVEEGHTWNDGPALLRGLELLQAPVASYAREVARICADLGVVFKRDIGVRGGAAVRNGWELEAECELWLEETSEDGSPRWFGWRPDTGWYFYAADPRTGTKGSTYLGEPFTPAPADVAVRIAERAAGRTAWSPPRTRRDASDPAGWEMVAAELAAVLPEGQMMRG